MTQHTPARYHASRTVPQGRSDDIILAAAFTMLLVLSAAIAAGMTGALVALVVGPALGYVASRTFSPPATVPVAATCRMCEVANSQSGRCPAHR